MEFFGIDLKGCHRIDLGDPVYVGVRVRSRGSGRF